MTIPNGEKRSWLTTLNFKVRITCEIQHLCKDWSPLSTKIPSETPTTVSVRSALSHKWWDLFHYRTRTITTVNIHSLKNQRLRIHGLFSEYGTSCFDSCSFPFILTRHQSIRNVFVLRSYPRRHNSFIAAISSIRSYSIVVNLESSHINHLARRSMSTPGLNPLLGMLRSLLSLLWQPTLSVHSIQLQIGIIIASNI